MRVLGIGARLDLGAVYMALQREGHEVRAYMADASHQGAFEGIIDPVRDWRAELDWVGRDGLVLFEKVGMGAEQDRLRAEGYRVVGGSLLGDRLEYDRALGQDVLREAGCPTARSWSFDGPEDAAAWLRAHPGRYVLKHHENARRTTVGEHPEGADILFRLERLEPGKLLLMERLEGVEVGVGAYFDGRRFLRPACIDFEHKRFFPGELGEMTGEMGTLAAYRGSEKLFAATLDRVAPRLAAGGHVGYVNVNMIVNERGTFPLEFTCRFGNPGFAVLGALQRCGWGELFEQMLDPGNDGTFPADPDWSVAIVISVPPFPEEDRNARPEDDPPLFFLHSPDEAEVRHHWYSDVRVDGGQLHARRRTGYAMVVTGTGATVEEAQRAATARARNVVGEEVRWRNDIGDRFLLRDQDRLRALGWLE